MKVLVGICTGGTVHAQTVVSLVSALARLRDEGILYGVSIQIGGDKPHNMNKLVAEAKRDGYDSLMSIDADMIFPADGIIRLIDADKDIVGANYAVRGNSVVGDPHHSTVKVKDEEGNLVGGFVPDHLFRAAALGNGFTLYKMSVFDVIEDPWFKNTEMPNGEWMTEDVDFCLRADKAGLEVWCNPKINMGHIGTTTY